MNEISLREGTVLHSPKRDYVVIKVLGRGGFGITYLVESELQVDNIMVTTRFAVKEHFIGSLSSRDFDSQQVLSSGPVTDEVERSMKAFIAEATRLQKLGINHPNIVRVNEIFTANNTAYYVMEYLDGCSLTDYVKEHKRLTWDQVTNLLRPVCDAVGVLHANQVAHYDIKPHNIMVVKTKNSERAVLIDFGLAKHYDGKGNATSSIAAAGYTHGYAPVEQYGGISSFQPAADVYALAATIVYCLTGQAPARAQELDLKALNKELQKVGLPADICTKLLKALEYRPADRPADAGKLASSLFEDEPCETQRAPLSAGTVVKGTSSAKAKTNSKNDTVRPGAKPTKPAKIKINIPGKRPKWLIPAVAAGAVAIVAGVVILLLPDKKEEPQPVIAEVVQVQPQPVVEVIDTIPEADSIIEEVVDNQPNQQQTNDQSQRRNTNRPAKQAETTPAPKPDKQEEVIEQLSPEQMYQKGMQLLRSNPSQAAHLLRDAATQGHIKAQYQYGLCLETGTGVGKNVSEAVGWYRQSADKGYADAQYQLGWCYEHGKGIGLNINQAAHWYQLAAGQGHTKAQYSAGYCYYYGRGVKKDHKLAFRYFSDAANKGNVRAITALALCYEEGNGVKKNRDTAYQYYLEAANKGDSSAQFKVGYFYEKGWAHLEKNKTMALEWYRKAAAQGHGEAKSAVTRLEAEGYR